jgi:hypothetical protein
MALKGSLMFHRSKPMLALVLFACVAAAPPGMPGGTGGTGGTQPEPMGPPAPAYQPMNQPSPTATVDPGMLRQAKTWFAALQSGTVDRSQLAAKASSSLTDADLAQAKAMIGNLGTPASFEQQQAASQGGISFAIYLVTFKSGAKYDFFFAVDQQGKVQGLKLGRPQ